MNIIIRIIPTEVQRMIWLIGTLSWEHHPGEAIPNTTIGSIRIGALTIEDMMIDDTMTGDMMIVVTGKIKLDERIPTRLLSRKKASISGIAQIFSVMPMQTGAYVIIRT